MENIKSVYSFFQEKRDGAGRASFSTIQRCTAAIRVLAYGSAGDAINEYLRMSEAVVRQCVIHFVDGVITVFENEYLRRPNADDLARLLNDGEKRGFPGMMGSIDCMHWRWKNCPTAWQGIYGGKSGKPTIILEAVASSDLWIWHAFFGTLGSLNDINVLHRSPIFQEVLEGRAPKVNYSINGHDYNMGYYLTDGIYPAWATFVKSIRNPVTRKHKLFPKQQESVRKDIERAFGVLQARFAFIRLPCLIWDDRIMGKILKACIIIHNMIVEDERHTYENYDHMDQFTETQNKDAEEADGRTPQISLLQYVTNKAAVEDRALHETLKNDLIENIWQKFGPNS